MVMQALRSEATIARIFSAAGELFLARAFADVTMDEIAARARVTKGALYHHFESKDELFVAMMSADLEEKRRIFTETVESTKGCRPRLRALTAAYFALPRTKRDLIQLVRRTTNIFDEPLRSRLVRAYQTALPQPVERVLREGVRDREIRAADPRLLSWHFVALVETTLTRYADSVFPTHDAKLAHVLDLFFRGVNA